MLARSLTGFLERSSERNLFHWWPVAAWLFQRCSHFLRSSLSCCRFPLISAIYTEHFFTWLSVGDFHADFAYLLDPLSGIYILFVTGVGLLIHIYATGYMRGDPGFYRFFSYLNLFMFDDAHAHSCRQFASALCWLGGCWPLFVFADRLLHEEKRSRLRGQEGIHRKSNRRFWIHDRNVPDVYHVWNDQLCIQKYGVDGIIAQASREPMEAFGTLGVLTAIALLMFVGATGKSAQIPLFVWLPDAMAGPTPVSALIHAATMVTAGVYLVTRMSSVFVKAPSALAVVAVIGALTAIVAATIGIAQNDIKKVLAYSTISQLGYMFLACGVGAFTAGIFHVMTHAFFKALLFLGSGSVIHGMHDEQDMRKMGGLKKYMPITFVTMMAGWLAISGFPLMSGFFSKDEILWRTWSTGSLPPDWGR